MNTSSLIKQHVQNWLKTIIIGYNFCPFAQPEFEQNRIYYCIDNRLSLKKNAKTLINEAQRLDNNPDIETTLLIYTSNFKDFDDFLDYLELANYLLNNQGYEGIYQLASFHPNYCFANSDDHDPANYTNRSPYPILHLIRESSIERALQFYPHPDKIPERNIALTRELGLAKMQALLVACQP
jgi:hypothetical protein